MSIQASVSASGSLTGVKPTMMAAGGIVTSPTLAVMGEQFKHEAVLPLDRNTGWAQTVADLLQKSGGVGSGGELQPIILEVDGEVFARFIINRANQERRRTGLSPIMV